MKLDLPWHNGGFVRVTRSPTTGFLCGDKVQDIAILHAAGSTGYFKEEDYDKVLVLLSEIGYGIERDVED